MCVCAHRMGGGREGWKKKSIDLGSEGGKKMQAIEKQFSPKVL